MPRFPPTPEGLRLKVATFNIFLRPPLVSEPRPGGDQKQFRLEVFLRALELGGYDVICLQEVFESSSRVSEIIARAEALGFCYSARSWAPLLPPWKVVGPALLILSRYPLAERKCLFYRGSTGIDSIMAKGALYAKLILSLEPRRVVHVVTTHTQSGELKNGHDIRMQQLEQLADFIAVHCREEEVQGVDALAPVVILGDLNVDARNDKIRGKHSWKPGKACPLEGSPSYHNMLRVLQRGCCGSQSEAGIGATLFAPLEDVLYDASVTPDGNGAVKVGSAETDTKRRRRSKSSNAAQQRRRNHHPCTQVHGHGVLAVLPGTPTPSQTIRLDYILLAQTNGGVDGVTRLCATGARVDPLYVADVLEAWHRLGKQRRPKASADTPGDERWGVEPGVQLATQTSDHFLVECTFALDEGVAHTVPPNDDVVRRYIDELQAACAPGREPFRGRRRILWRFKILVPVVLVVAAVAAVVALGSYLGGGAVGGVVLLAFTTAVALRVVRCFREDIVKGYTTTTRKALQCPTTSSWGSSSDQHWQLV